MLMNWDKLTAVFLLVLTVFYLLIINRYPLISDEGTHALLSLFYRDLGLTVLKTLDLSLTKAYQFGMSYLVHYPKLQVSYTPLYHLITGFISYTLFGISSFSARFTNLVFTIATFVVFYQLVKLKFDSKTAFFSLLVFSLFSETMVLTWLALMDFTGLFFVLLSIYVYTLAKESGKKTFYFLTGLFAILAVLGKRLAVVIIPYFLIDTFLSKKSKFQKLILILIPMVLIVPYFLLIREFGVLEVNELVFSMHIQPMSEMVSRLYGMQKLYPMFLLLFLSFGFYIYKKKKYWKGMLMWVLITFPGIVFIYFTQRLFQYFFIPMYMAAGYWISRANSKMKAAVFILLIYSVSIFLVTTNNLYPERVDNEISKYIYDNIPENGNVAMFSEGEFYSSTFMFPLAKLDENKNIVFYRPCVFYDKGADEIITYLKENNVYFVLADSDERGYDNIDKISDYLTEVSIDPVELYEFKEFDGHEKSEYCNYVCLTQQEYCTEYGSPFDVYK